MNDRKTTEISISGVRKLLASESSSSDGILEFLDNLLGAILALSPAIVGPAALPLLALIEPKNELMKAAKATIRKLSKAEQDNFTDRATRIAAANCLITFTAYFDTLARSFPEIMKDVGLKNYEKTYLAVEASRQTYDEQANGVINIFQPDQDSSIVEQPVEVPHPAENPQEATAARKKLYINLSQATLRFLEGLVVWESIPSNKREQVRQAISDKIPEVALAAYDAQYLTLAIDFPEFFVWATLTEARKTQMAASQVSVQLQTNRDLVIAASKDIDVGLRNLAEAISASMQTATLDKKSAAAITSDALHCAYEDQISLPVIEDSYDEVERDTLQLNFPSKHDAFVPQAYKVTRYIPGDTHLDNEDEWEKCKTFDDLGPFIVRYLQTAYSTETPLLILGHPGSGKSLLTELISARLAYPSYTTVRVKLRDIDADAELQGQIEEQIRTETGRTIAWVDLADALNASPPIVILDGYDELLQASGKVFADYLQSVRRFQHREAVQGRPVRVIVTSRVTLIDKASIPAGSTVIRLLDFDVERQQKWVDVWNQCNQQYFQAANVAPFSMPDNVKVANLAGQPLLLLMLAVYDSESNQLSQNANIDQTVLYDNLLRRFIYRERAKGKEGKNFVSLPLLEQTSIIDRDMTRLGIAAIGMFNRQSVHIQQTELNADIEYFGLEQVVGSSTGRRLTQADLLLGSFFFIHESKAKGAKNDSTTATGTSAFEFLHNTFGEFLTADFMLNRISEVVLGIQELKASANLRPMLPSKLTAMSEDWLACLIHTPLHTRPVILAMLKEWSGHFFDRPQPGRSELVSSLRMLITMQVKTILDGYSLIDLSERDHKPAPYPRLPMLGHLAIYSLNLIELYVVLSENGAELTDAELGNDRGGCRPWDRLVSLWRSWLPVEALDEAATVLRARRIGAKLCFEVQDALDVRKWREGRLGVIYSSALGLGDSISAGLVGICLSELDGAEQETIDAIETMLSREAVNLSLLTQTQLAMVASRSDPIALSRVMRPHGSSVGRRVEQEFTPLLMRVYELIAHLPPSYMSLTRFRCSAGSLAEMAKLHSRYQVELFVTLRTSVEPRWLPSLLIDAERQSLDRPIQEKADREQVRHLWQDVLQSTSAAPLLRAAVSLLPAIFIKQIAPMLREVGPESFKAFDAETAALVAIVGDIGRDREVRKLGLNTLVNGLTKNFSTKRLIKDPSWNLAKMPLATLGQLVNILINVGELAEYRQAMLNIVNQQMRVIEKSFNDELPEGGSLKASISGILGINEFRIQCARLGAFYDNNSPSQFVNSFFDYVNLPSTQFYRTVLLFIRFAREQNRPELVIESLKEYERVRRGESEGRRLSRSTSPGEDLSLLQIIASERIRFSATEIDDIAWAKSLFTDER